MQSGILSVLVVIWNLQNNCKEALMLIKSFEWNSKDLIASRTY